MSQQLGEKNLIILLNSEIPPEPVIHGIHRLAMAHMDKFFTIVTGADLRHLSGLLEVVEIIHAPKEEYQIIENQSSGIQGNVLEMNKLIDELEGKGYDRVFQIGALEWGRWLPVSLQPLGTEVVKVSGQASSLDIYRRFCNAFQLNEETEIKQPGKVYVDFGSLEYDVQEIFTYDNLAQYCQWLHLVEKNDLANVDISSGGALITSCRKNFEKWSVQGHKTIYLDSRNENYENNLFLQNQYSLKINKENVDAAQLFNSLSLWKRNRLNEYGLIQLSNDIEFFQVVKPGQISICQSTKDLNQEYGIIQDVTRIFKVVLDDPEDVSRAKIESYFSKNSLDRFAILNALYSIKYISFKIIEALDNQNRIFSEFANDYYKVSLGHEIVEILCSGENTPHVQENLKNRLQSYMFFIESIEEYVDNRVVAYRKQGE